MAKATKQSVNGESIAGDNDLIARSLKSDRQSAADVAQPMGPDALLALAHRFDQRLRSSGGRPTDPNWTLSRRIPLKSETWEALQIIAESLSARGTSVAPAQVASVLLEDQLALVTTLDDAARRAYVDRLKHLAQPDPPTS